MASWDRIDDIVEYAEYLLNLNDADTSLDPLRAALATDGTLDERWVRMVEAARAVGTTLAWDVVDTAANDA